MKIGLPKGLLNYKYSTFFETFFFELGTEIVYSSDTNKEILDLGVKHCVDEACLPIKIFHGHVASLRDKCDLLITPRIMQIRKKEFICPKFCGLPEMLVNSIPNLPMITTAPLYFFSKEKLYSWCIASAEKITKDRSKVKAACTKAMEKQNNTSYGIKNQGFRKNIALIGHPYNIYDSFINMNLVKKLNKLGVGVITEEFVEEKDLDIQIQKLYKRPFWNFARNAFGFSTFMAEQKKIDGIIYISSFACGIDSVVIELIKSGIDEFPFMVLKIDEHTGEAGLETRIEAFVDMLGGGINYESNLSPLR
ncbi:2-hydroxyglutaryl-CoA dehydratase [Fervidicella metallireducens AeB]|uniref:2-hydroxyglutaryl-CoA dehydratase n=1 Tax=Fervidicella metallireducens AeB TaxID=1403537 RepID=A0A017RTM8_9CLOT|nr:acyl-CoA dehydratase activase-related protein [Fervidicella metallireducens]EYE87956.1 2-hydroxyglutaryl-CoA dehydratase [Fervidicella metallireducens AeB]